MATVINTNVGSLMAQNAISKNSRSLSEAMDQLSTGKRINSAADDAAGLAISSKMTAQINGLDQAVRNANDGISLLQTAEGATIEITNMLQRMRELAVQASNDTYTNEERGYLNLEFQQLTSEMSRIASNTQWNGMDILDGVQNTYNFQVGANANQTIDVDISDLRSLMPSEAVAQVGNYTVGNNLAGGASATITVNGNVYAITGTVSAGQVEQGNYTVGNNLAAGESATLTLGGQTFTVTGAAATAQQDSVTLSPGASFASTDTMSITINGQSFVVHGQEHTATTARDAATALAAAINSNANQAQVDKFAIGSTTTASGVFAVTVNGQTYTVNGSEHNASTASGIAAALASKVNENPLARIANATFSNGNVTAGNAVSITVAGNTYILASATGDASTTITALAALINGNDVAQVGNNTVTARAAGTSARVAVNGTDYTLISAANGGYTSAQVASVLAGKINGIDIAQVEHISGATHSVNINMNLAMTVNGTKYSVAAIDHVAVTRASAMNLLANKINNNQTAVSALVSGDVMVLRAAEAGVAFSTGSLSIGSQTARTATLVVANNTAQTAVSATASGARVVLTALTAGTGFSTSVTNNGTAGTTATTTYNQTAQSLVSASLSASGNNGTLVLTATTAGTTFTNGANLNVAGTDYTMTETRPNSEGQTAVTATTSGAYLILTANTAGAAFSVGNATVKHLEVQDAALSNINSYAGTVSVTVNGIGYGIDQFTLGLETASASYDTSAEVATAFAAILNATASTARTITVAASNVTAAMSVNLTVDGTVLTLTSAMNNGAATATQVADRMASIINADATLGNQVSATAAAGLLTITSKSNGFAEGLSNLASVSRFSATGVAAMGATSAVTVTVIGQTASKGGYTATASAANLRITGTTAGTALSIGATVTGIGATLSTAQGVGFSTTVSNYAANLVAQNAVSATVNNGQITLTATTAGTAFTAGAAKLGSESFATTTTTANDAGGTTAANVAASLAAQANAALSDLTVANSGTTIGVQGTVNGATISAGQLNDGTSSVSFTVTQAARDDVSGNDASDVAAQLAALVNAGESNVAATVSGDVITMTAATAGVGFTGGVLDDGTAEVAYTAVTANESVQAISSEAGAQAAISLVDNVLQTVNLERAKLGAVMNRLEYAIDNLANVSMNTSESRSRIEDADYAKATTELAKTQIIQQAATSMLAQANQQPQMVLSLLQ